MRISSRTEYALRTVLELVLQRGNGPIRVADIAKKGRIPAKFLEQILLTLKNGGIVQSRRGVKGGYLLAKAPAEITLASIMSLTEGYPISADLSGENDSGARALQEIWTTIDDFVIGKLETVTIEQIYERESELRKQACTEYAI